MQIRIFHIWNNADPDLAFLDADLDLGLLKWKCQEDSPWRGAGARWRRRHWRGRGPWRAPWAGDPRGCSRPPWRGTPPTGRAPGTGRSTCNQIKTRLRRYGEIVCGVVKRPVTGYGLDLKLSLFKRFRVRTYYCIVCIPLLSTASLAMI